MTELWNGIATHPDDSKSVMYCNDLLYGQLQKWMNDCTNAGYEYLEIWKK